MIFRIFILFKVFFFISISIFAILEIMAMDESTLKCFSLPKNFAYNKKLFIIFKLLAARFFFIFHWMFEIQNKIGNKKKKFYWCGLTQVFLCNELQTNFILRIFDSLFKYMYLHVHHTCISQARHTKHNIFTKPQTI